MSWQTSGQLMPHAAHKSVRIWPYVLALLAWASGAALAAEAKFVCVNGQRLLGPDGGDFHIRAMGTGSTAADPIEKDYEDIARRKFNAVTVFLSYRRFSNQAEPGKT